MCTNGISRALRRAGQNRLARLIQVKTISGTKEPISRRNRQGRHQIKQPTECRGGGFHTGVTQCRLAGRRAAARARVAGHPAPQMTDRDAGRTLPRRPARRQPWPGGSASFVLEARLQMGEYRIEPRLQGDQQPPRPFPVTLAGDIAFPESGKDAPDISRARCRYRRYRAGPRPARSCIDPAVAACRRCRGRPGEPSEF